MDRRAFFRAGIGRASEAAVEAARARANRRAARWVRPPYALDELELLLACTRCGACVEACPRRIVFPLHPRLGAQVAGTPALDLVNGACALCADWPCARACEPGALRPPVPDGEDADGPTPPPRLARATLSTERCLPYLGPECGACRGSCPVPGAMVWEGERPRIVGEVCVGCARCREACILEPAAIAIESLHRATAPGAQAPV